MTDPVGQWTPADSATEFSKVAFLVRMMMNRMSTVTLVQVKAANIPTQPGAAGTVDVTPLVNLTAGDGTVTKHGVLHGLPYLRMQAGTWGIILDPQVGDIGIAIFADRDISSVKKNKAVSNPGSARRFDMADGIYLGGVLNTGSLNQYLQFRSTGVRLIDQLNSFIRFNATGFTLQDFSLNAINSSSGGITVTDVNGNSIALNASGMTVTDKNGNTVAMSSTGVNITPAAAQKVTVTGPETVTGALIAQSTVDVTALLTAHAGFKFGSNAGAVTLNRSCSTSGTIPGGTYASGAIAAYNFTMTGAAVGDYVALGFDASAGALALMHTTWGITSAGVLTIWVGNTYSGPLTPAAATFTAIALGP